MYDNKEVTSERIKKIYQGCKKGKGEYARYLITEDYAYMTVAGATVKSEAFIAIYYDGKNRHMLSKLDGETLIDSNGKNKIKAISLFAEKTHKRNNIFVSALQSGDDTDISEMDDSEISERFENILKTKEGGRYLILFVFDEDREVVSFHIFSNVIKKLDLITFAIEGNPPYDEMLDVVLMLTSVFCEDMKGTLKEFFERAFNKEA